MHFHFLYFLTNFGDPYLTGPLAAIIFVWLGFIRSWNVLIRWTLCFGAGVAIVAATKVAYAGWGVELEALHFTVVSGHSMLASAVYPTVFAICATHSNRRTIKGMFIGGFAFALAIGLSRVLFGFHSMAEVVTGLLVGTTAAAITCLPMLKGTERRAAHPDRRIAARRDPTSFAAIALAIIVVCHGKIAPMSVWIDMKAPQWQQWSKTRLDDAR